MPQAACQSNNFKKCIRKWKFSDRIADRLAQILYWLSHTTGSCNLLSHIKNALSISTSKKWKSTSMKFSFDRSPDDKQDSRRHSWRCGCDLRGQRWVRLSSRGKCKPCCPPTQRPQTTGPRLWNNCGWCKSPGKKRFSFWSLWLFTSKTYLSNSIEFPDERSASDVPHSQSLRGNVEQGVPVSLNTVHRRVIVDSLRILSPDPVWKTWFLNPPPGWDDLSALRSYKIWFCDDCPPQECVSHLVCKKQNIFIFENISSIIEAPPTCMRDHGLWPPPSCRGQCRDCHTGKTDLYCLHTSASGHLETRRHRWGCPHYCGTPTIANLEADQRITI